jgi:ABC-type lipoprotein release transport system permease subunit
MTILKLASRNLLGAGLRTWLNVFVLSLAYVAIVWMQGLYEGMNEQISSAMINSEIGGGQYWQVDYDPFDPFTLEKAHAVIPAAIRPMIAAEAATAVLITQATIYPNGQIRPALLKGIAPGQKILDLPSHVLSDHTDEIPALIGSRMAKSAQLTVGDYVTVRWRDVNGTFDARDVFVVEIMQTNVQSIDNGQLWLPLRALQEMTGMPDQATLVVVAQNIPSVQEAYGWSFKDHAFLLQDLRKVVQQKTISATIMYVILLFLAMLAIFDTQILAIFRRRKEIGTLISLGMTRGKVIQLFTLEGSLHGVLAALVGAVYGIPLCVYSYVNGLKLPQSTDSYGFALGQSLYPVYTVGLVAGTVLLVMTVVTIVSFLPTRKIARLRPTDALRGKMI